ncbi:MAG TPA: aquaporin [Vicinamibacterales bacterium]|nr:aquaporin [Vicinamibacterales bacterium]
MKRRRGGGHRSTIEMASMGETLRKHWPEYLMEGAELALFLVAAAVVTSLIHHPASPIRHGIEDPVLRRLVVGALMGLTLIGLVQSPWGRQSGAHMNPSLTLTFLRLGKVAPWDAAFYVVAQFAGAIAGIVLAATVIGPALASPEVDYVATRPGTPGPAVAFAGEAAISFVLMLTVLNVSNTMRLSRYTPYFVGVLVATYITLESPLSGMSMNPARTLGPALLGQIWDALWIYFTAPLLGMLLAAEIYVRRHGAGRVWCAKLQHDTSKRCIFRCAHPAV